MIVRNMTGRTGRAVANQFIIEHNGRTYFQSYELIIACKNTSGGIEIDRSNWDYSVTTSKYRNQFLGETKKETQAKIDSGEYVLTDLNG